MTRIIALGAAATLLAACSSEQSGAADQATPETMAEAPAHALPAPENDVPGRAYRHTSLAGCEVVREEHEEMPFVETLCPGPAGWALRVTDSDARQNLVVVVPGGLEASLELSRIGGGGFSSLGETAEWRGPAGPDFAPDSLIVRYNVVEDPESNVEVSYLLPVRLAQAPCVIGKVAPGAAQNARARDIADAGGTCLID